MLRADASAREGLAAHAVAVARPDSIVLMHGMQHRVGFKVRALDAMLTGLVAAGYRFVRMDELLRAGGLRRGAGVRRPRRDG